MTQFLEARVNPPWVDEKHFADCEDRRFWKCPECKALTSDTWLNLCDWGCDLKFIPRVDECVCEQIENWGEHV
jgi:hypothetical protein